MVSSAQAVWLHGSRSRGFPASVASLLASSFPQSSRALVDRAVWAVVPSAVVFRASASYRGLSFLVRLPWIPISFLPLGFCASFLPGPILLGFVLLGAFPVVGLVPRFCSRLRSSGSGFRAGRSFFSSCLTWASWGHLSCCCFLLFLGLVVGFSS